MQENWNFENTYLNLPKIFYSNTKVENFPNLKLLLKNENLITLLNLENNNFENFIIKSIIIK